MEHPIVTVIYGTTGTGKSQLAINLATKTNGVIISADSRKVYKDFDIGTNKVKLQKASKELNVKLIDVLSPDVVNTSSRYNVHYFLKDVHKIINDCIVLNRRPIIVGGTMLYITALVKGYTLRNARANTKLRMQLEPLSVKNLQDKLKKVSPVIWKNLPYCEKSNKRRLIRWIEIGMQNKLQISERKKVMYKFNFKRLVLDNKIDLYANLYPRVVKMLNMGLIDEVQALRRRYPNNPLLNTMGYKETIMYLDKKFDTIEELAEKITNAHVKYAKYQMRWIKKYLMDAV